MIFCPKCSSILSDNAIFCINCGYKITEKDNLMNVPESNTGSNSNNYPAESPVFSNDPEDLARQSAEAMARESTKDTGANFANANQSQNGEDDTLKNNAGKTFADDEQVGEYDIGEDDSLTDGYDDFDDCEDYDDRRDGYYDDKSKISRKKLIAILSVTIGVIVVALVVCIILFMQKDTDEKSHGSTVTVEPEQKSDGKPEPVSEDPQLKEKTLVSSNGRVYFSNSGMYYYDFESEESILLSDVPVSIEDADKYYNEDVYVTSDSEYIYYIEDKYYIEIAGSSLSYAGRLCMRSLDDIDEEALIIADDVATYRIFEDKNIVVYETSDGIYEYDIKDETCYFVSYKKDIEYLDNNDYGYLTDDGKVYYKEAGKNEVYIDSGVETLYGDANAFYFEKSTEKDFPYKDFVEYDIELMESEPAEPKEPDEPLYEDYSTDEEYDMAYEKYETEYEEYYEAYDEYLELYDEYCNQQIIRDNMGIIESGVYTESLYDIYSVKGGVGKKLSENASFISSPDGSGCYFLVFDFDLTEKLKLSQIEYVDAEITDFALGARVSKCHILCNGNAFMVDKDKDALEVWVSKDYKKIAFSVLNRDKETVDIYSADFDGKNISGTKYLCSGAEEVWFSSYNDVICFVRNYDDDSFSYFVNTKEYKVDASALVSVSPKGEVAYTKGVYYDCNLCVTKDGKRVTQIDSGEIQDVFYDADGTLIYTKRNGSQNQICIYANGKTEIVAQDCTDYVDFKEDSELKNFMFIDDGILYKVKDGEAVKICENASAVIDTIA